MVGPMRCAILILGVLQGACASGTHVLTPTSAPPAEPRQVNEATPEAVEIPAPVQLGTLPPAFDEKAWTRYRGPSPDAHEYLACRKHVVHKGWAGYLVSCRSYSAERHGAAVVLDHEGNQLERYQFDRGVVRERRIYEPNNVVRFVRRPADGPVAMMTGRTLNGALEGPLSKWARSGALIESNVYRQGLVVPAAKERTAVLHIARTAQEAITSKDGGSLLRLLSASSLDRFRDARELALRVNRKELRRLKPHQQMLILLMRVAYRKDLQRASVEAIVARSICSRACAKLRLAKLGDVNLLGDHANIEVLRRGKTVARIWFVWENRGWRLALNRLMDAEDESWKGFTLEQIGRFVALLVGDRFTEAAWAP